MKKVVSLFLALLMVLSVCSIASAEDKQITHLVAISAGSRQPAHDVVLEAANEYSREKYGIELEVRFLDWDPSKVYPIIMATGDGVDLVWYSNWPGSSGWARKGAFVELDEYLEMPEFAALKAAVPEQSWNDVKIDGHIYEVPAPEVSYSGQYGICYRADLCEKLNLPVPDTEEHVVEYLMGVKAAYPDVCPFGSVFDRAYEFKALDRVIWPGVNTFGLILDEAGESIVKYYGSEDHLHDMRLANQFVKDGLISRDRQNEAMDNIEKFPNNLTMMEVCHVDTYFGRVNAIEKAKQEDPSKADWELGYIPFNAKKGYVQVDSATGVNGTGIAYAYSDHIMESLTYLQAVLTDPELHHLLRYGVKGVHYDLDADGNYVRLSQEYEPCGMSLWQWRSDALSLEGATDKASKEKKEILDLYKFLTPMSSSFSFDKTNVEDEVANYNAVFDEYYKPLQYGLVDDVEGQVKLFLEKAEQAGLSKIQEEYIKQYTAWAEANK